MEIWLEQTAMGNSSVFLATILGIVATANLMPRLLPARIAAALILVLSGVGLLGFLG